MTDVELFKSICDQYGIQENTDNTGLMLKVKVGNEIREVKVINVGNCMMCGNPIRIIPRRGNGITPNIFFCSKCERQMMFKQAESEEENADSN